MRKAIIGTRGTSAIPEFAGSTWVRLQYVLGLQKLGMQTFLVDQIWRDNKSGRAHSLDYLMDMFHRPAVDFGFCDR